MSEPLLIEFEVDLLAEGVPRGKRGRPLMPAWQRRVATKHHSYTPPVVRVWKGIIQREFRRSAPHGFEPTNQAVWLGVTLYVPIPTSWPQWRRREAASERVPFTGVPDRDNVLKLVQDALNKRAWVDDRQVYDGPTRKFYSPRPRLEVKMEVHVVQSRRAVT